MFARRNPPRSGWVTAGRLNLDANAKTVKGQKKGFKTAILYLAPADLSGREVCPFRRVAK